MDFVENMASKRKDIIQTLSKIGFHEDNKYFKHPETQYFIEYPAGPLAIGREPVREPYTIQFETGTLKLLSPTDSVKDRLSAYYHGMINNVLIRLS